VSKPLDGLDIRYTRVLDSSYLRDWISDPRVERWLPSTNEAEREELIKTWIYFSRFQGGLTATIDHVPCAMAMLFLMPYRKVSHHAPFKICVNPKLWNRGIGTALLKNLKHLAKEYLHLEAIHIEVFGDNPIIEILKKFDFHEFARQEQYVKTAEGVYLPRICFISEWEKKQEAVDGK
jgi:RimJ/RimL family protein N-acetyltransferase